MTPSSPPFHTRQASKEEPVNFWFAKVFLLGGLALGELSEAVPTPVRPRNGRGAGR